MLPDRSDGGSGRAGQAPSSVRAHLLGDHPLAIWQGGTCGFPRAEPVLQHIWLCIHDPDWFAIDSWHCGDPFRGCHDSHSSGRYCALPLWHSVRSCLTITLLVVLYTAVGGLKATFLTDYLHTAVALILIIYFTLSILSHEAIGGLYGLYDKVTAVAPDNYIPGNYQGSLLTMKSHDAIIWGLILKFGNLALVVMVRLAPSKTATSPSKGSNPRRTPLSGRSPSRRKSTPPFPAITWLQSPSSASHGASGPSSAWRPAPFTTRHCSPHGQASSRRAKSCRDS